MEKERIWYMIMMSADTFWRVCYVLTILKCFTYIKRDILRIMNISITEGEIMSIMA